MAKPCTEIGLDEELLASVYEGILEPVPWTSFLRLFCDRIQALSVGFILRAPREGDRGLVLGEGVGSLEWDDAYRTRYFALDPFIDLPLGEPTTVRELIPTEELVKSEMYHLLMEPAGILYGIGLDMCEPGGIYARLRASRSAEQADFGEKEKELCRRLMPHLQRALRIHARIRSLESERDLYANTVEQFSVGTVLLDEQGKVLQMNRVAEQLIERESGLSVQEDRLLVADRKASETLDRLIASALAQRGAKNPSIVGACRIERPSGQGAIGVLIRPIVIEDEREREARPSVAVFLNQPMERSAISSEIVQKIFPFTAMEAKVASLLAGGLRGEEAAGALGISIYTLKSHLRAIFSKTGVSRQAELVRLVLTSVANLG